jgi:hypothetical protein
MAPVEGEAARGLRRVWPAPLGARKREPAAERATSRLLTRGPFTVANSADDAAAEAHVRGVEEEAGSWTSLAGRHSA